MNKQRQNTKALQDASKFFLNLVGKPELDNTTVVVTQSVSYLKDGKLKTHSKSNGPSKTLSAVLIGQLLHLAEKSSDKSAFSTALSMN